MLEWNVFANLMVFTGTYITRYKKMSKEEQDRYDDIYRINYDFDVENLKMKTPSDIELVEELITKNTYTGDNLLIIRFIKDIHDIKITDVHTLRKKLRRITFLIGYNEIKNSNAITLLAMMTNVDTSVVIRLMKKVIEYKALDWNDLDDIFNMFNGKFGKTILGYVNTNTLDSFGFDLLIQ